MSQGVVGEVRDLDGARQLSLRGPDRRAHLGRESRGVFGLALDYGIHDATGAKLADILPIQSRMRDRSKGPSGVSLRPSGTSPFMGWVNFTRRSSTSLAGNSRGIQSGTAPRSTASLKAECRMVRAKACSRGADKGYHSRDALKALDGGAWKSRISAPHHDEFLRWHGDDAARRAVYNNRTRLLSGVARQAFKLRAELVERGFALILDRGGMRRVWLRGRENVQKRYLIHVAGYNLGLVMRLLTGAGTPREFQRQAFAWFFAILEPDGGLIAMILVITDNQVVAGAVYIATVDSS